MNVSLTIDHEFAAYRLPDSNERVLMIGTFHNDRLNYNIHSFCVGHSDRSEARLQLVPREIFTNIPWTFSASGLIERICTDEKNYGEQVQKIIRSVQHRGADKIVLSRIIHEPHKVKNVYALFDEMCANYPKSMVYVFHSQKTGTWIGAAPETLLSWDNVQAMTESLAGTRHIEEREDWDRKNQEEQVVVTHFISKILSNYGISFDLQGPRTVQRAHLNHIQSKITFKVQPYMDHLLRQLHPTPATWGSPRKKAIDFIHNIEKHHRRFYTGYIGVIHPDIRHHFFVNIRCMELTESSAYLYVGGGITAKSVAQKEWKETEDKADVLRNILNSSEFTIA